MYWTNLIFSLWWNEKKIPCKLKFASNSGPCLCFSITRCCKVGEKTARKEMTCSMDEHAAERSRNYAHRAKLAVLSERAQVTKT